jgi:glycolate oxidase
MSTLSFNTPLTDAFLVDLRTLLQPADLLMGPEDLERFGHDETEDLRFPPQVVVQPRTTEQVAAVVKSLRSSTMCPLRPWARARALAAARWPYAAAWVLSMAKMDAIIPPSTKRTFKLQ